MEGDRFTADQARQVVAEANVAYRLGEVYEKIERLARSGRMWATFREERWSGELMRILTENGYGLRVVPRSTGNVICVTWGPKSRELREGVGD